MTPTFRTMLVRSVPLAAALALACLVLAASAAGRGSPLQLIPVLAGVGYAISGRLIVTREAGNTVGWILGATGIVLALAGLTDGYSESAPGSDPVWAFQLAGWVSQLVWFVFLQALVGIALPLVFPNGRLPSRRWRWVAWTGAIGTLLTLASVGLEPGPMEVAGEAANPFGVTGSSTVLSVAETIGFALSSAGVLGAGAAVIVRLRRSRGVERQQLKWFAYVAAMIVAGLSLAALSSLDSDAAWAHVVGPVGWFTMLGMVAIGIPVATGFAVLRHRLYDIDVVIKRTLVYGALTATLGAAYVAGVLVLQFVFSPSSDFAIAASTLAVAALFRPARNRIQAAVDRRFYRSTYDAARTVESFGARLREQVSLETLSDELRDVVHDTVQPAHVSVWLRDPAR